MVETRATPWVKLGTVPCSGPKWEEGTRRRTWTETGKSEERDKKTLVARNSYCYSAVAPLLEFPFLGMEGRELILLAGRCAERRKENGILVATFEDVTGSDQINEGMDGEESIEDASELADSGEADQGWGLDGW